MLEVGKEFIINGSNYCVLDVFSFENSNYAFLSREQDKISYVFYAVLFEQGNYTFYKVEDKELNFKLMEYIESKMVNYE